MKCSHCGAEIPEGALFCRKCGTRVEPERKNEPKQNVQNQEKDKPHAKPSKTKNGGWISVLLAAVIVLLLAVMLGIRVFNNQAQQDPSPSSRSQQAGQANLETEEEKTVLQQDAQPTSASSLPQPASSKSAEQWGQQEILVAPRGNGEATLTLLQMNQGSWVVLFECDAAIGRNGTTNSPREGDGKTPEGSFPVLFCYGLEQPDTGIAFVKVEEDSVWVDDSNSEYYNCLTTRALAGNVSCEDTYSQFKRGFYSINLFFANNGDGQTPGSAIPGNGSVRVLEGYLKPLEPTNGDIKIAARDMETLLGMLEAEYDPVVTVLS